MSSSFTFPPRESLEPPAPPPPGPQPDTLLNHLDMVFSEAAPPIDPEPASSEAPPARKLLGQLLPTLPDEPPELPLIEIPASSTPDLSSSSTFHPQPPHSASHGHSQLVSHTPTSSASGDAVATSLPMDHALKTIFLQFVKLAERKLNTCASLPTAQTQLESLAPGADPKFDSVIKAMGGLAKKRPTQVVEAILYWRKSKVEVMEMVAKQEARMSVERTHSPSMSRQNSVRKPLSRALSISSFFKHKRGESRTEPAVELLADLSSVHDVAALKSQLSVYVISRVLLAIATEKHITGRIAPMVFSQITLPPLDPIQMANWDLFAQLLTIMSANDFANVSDRFIAELEKDNSGVDSVTTVLSAMGRLHLPIFPLEQFEEAAEFMASVVKFARKTRSLAVRAGYARAITALVGPMAGTITAEANHPVWARMVNDGLLFSAGDDEWAPALQVALLCVAPTEVFSEQWGAVADKCLRLLKPKVPLAARATALNHLSCLLWVYLYRCPELFNQTTKHLDQLWSGLTLRKNDKWFGVEVSLLQPVVEMLVAIGCWDAGYALESTIGPMLKLGLASETIGCEWVHAGVRAYAAIAASLEPPLFPGTDLVLVPPTTPKTSKTLAMHREVERLCWTALDRLHREVGQTAGPVPPSSPHQFRALAPQFAGLLRQQGHDKRVELLAAVIETLPWTCSVAVGRLVLVVVANVGHTDFRVSTAATAALKTLSAARGADVVTAVGQLAVEAPTAHMVTLYQQSIAAWMEGVEKVQQTGGVPRRFQFEGSTAVASEDSEPPVWREVAQGIEVAEGNGVFLMCSSDAGVRRAAVEVLKIVERFDEVVRDKTVASPPTAPHHLRLRLKFAADDGTRVIAVLRSVCEDALAPSRHVRLQHSLLQPAVVARLHEACPVAVALARALVNHWLHQLLPQVSRQLCGLDVMAQFQLYLQFSTRTLALTDSTDLFKQVVGLLDSGRSVRDMVVAGLVETNLEVYPRLLEEVSSQWGVFGDGGMTGVLEVLSGVLRKAEDCPSATSPTSLALTVALLKYTKPLLALRDHQQLRAPFCRLLAAALPFLHNHSLFPFEARLACFSMVAGWPMGEAGGQMSGGPQEQASTLAVAALCRGPLAKAIDTSVLLFDIVGLMEWAARCGSKKELRPAAVECIVNAIALAVADSAAVAATSDADSATPELLHRQVLELVVDCGYSPARDLFVAALAETPAGPVDPVRLTALALSLMSAPHRVRCAGLRILARTGASPSAALATTTPPVVEAAARRAARQFAGNTALACELARVGQFADDIGGVLLALAEVASGVVLSEDDTPTLLPLLFALTTRCAAAAPTPLAQVWVRLAEGHSTNANHILNHLFVVCAQLRQLHAVEVARVVALSLGVLACAPEVVSLLILRIAPRGMIPKRGGSEGEEVVIPVTGYTKAASFSQWINIRREVTAVAPQAFPSTSSFFPPTVHLALIFLGDILPLVVVPQAAVPLLLHVSISLLDHYSSVVQQQAGGVIGALVSQMAGGSAVEEPLASFLHSSANHPHLWTYDSLNTSPPATPPSMDALVRGLLTLAPLQQEWLLISLRYATTCAVRHIACRLFQVFRLLLCMLTPLMLRDMLHRLLNTVLDNSGDIAGFSLQILMTLNAVCAELDPIRLIDFPQLFWVLVACMLLVHEDEYLEVVSVLTKFLAKIDLGSEDTIQCLVLTFPAGWEGTFAGVQPLVMRGMQLQRLYLAAMRMLLTLDALPGSLIIAEEDTRVLYLVLCQMPRLLKTLGDGVVIRDSEMVTVATQLAALALPYPDLSRVFVAYAGLRFRLQGDFSQQVAACVVRVFFPRLEARAVVLLIGFLFNPVEWFKQETLRLLAAILPHTDFSRPEYAGAGPDLIAPLLTLLDSDLAEQALEVLALVPPLPEGGSGGSLYGVPDRFGWAVVAPTVTAATTRHNVHAVFATCTDGKEPEETLGVEQEEIQFQEEEWWPQETSELKNVYATLDNLDEFFGENETGAGMYNQVPGTGMYNPTSPTGNGFEWRSSRQW